MQSHTGVILVTQVLRLLTVGNIQNNTKYKTPYIYTIVAFLDCLVQVNS